MGTPTDHPLAVPGSGPSTLAVPSTAGGNPVPMDDETINQPVVAYFTFIQNNMAQISSGNALQVMREAEQRHLQIMHGVVDSIRSEWSSRLAMQEQEHEQRLQDVENKAINALNEERKRGDELEVRLNQAQASHDSRVEEFKAEANAKHDQKIAEERQRITSEFEASYAKTVEHATSAIAATKKQYEDQAAIEQARYIQLKNEFENYKKDMTEKINEAAAQNLSLQDQIDDLQEQLKHVAKAQHATAPDASVPKAEPATVAGVPHYSIATPRAQDATAAKGSDEPIHELKTPAVLAQEAKAKLDELLKGGSLQKKSAVGDDKPQLPTLTHSGFMTPTEAVKTPPNESPKGVAKQQQMMGTTELIELVKALTQRDEKDKPKTKEAELIKLNNMPAPESYRTWKNHVRDEVKSCSDRPDEAWAWLNEVYDQSCTRDELEKKLQEGDLATRILNFKEQQSRKGIQVRGRYVLLMFEDYFKTSEEAGSLYRVEDLLGVVKVGDTVQDLRRFINKWDATLAGMATTPDEAVLRDILLRQIRPSQLLKYDIEVFDRAHEKSHEKSYGFLHQSMKNLIDRER